MSIKNKSNIKTIILLKNLTLIYIMLIKNTKLIFYVYMFISIKQNNKYYLRNTLPKKQLHNFSFKTN